MIDDVARRAGKRSEYMNAQREGSGGIKNIMGFSKYLLGLNGEVERNPLKMFASLATLNARNTTMELGQDRDMRRIVPMNA